MNASVSAPDLTPTAADHAGDECTSGHAHVYAASHGGDRIDRLGALYQRARLRKRRMHRVVAEAVASGNVTAAQNGLTRYGRAAALEARFYAHYVRAVLAEHG